MIQEILKIADDANQGMRDPLKAFIELKKIEKVLKDGLDSIKDLAIREAGAYPEKSFELEEVTVSKSRAPGRWDYKGIDQWRKKSEELKKIEELAKTASKLAENNQTVSDADGVVVEPAIYTEGADIITIKIKS